MLGIAQPVKKTSRGKTISKRKKTSRGKKTSWGRRIVGLENCRMLISSDLWWHLVAHRHFS
jgi:hypothetical protein